MASHTAKRRRIGFDDPAAELALWIGHVRFGEGPLTVAVLDRIAELGGDVALARLLRETDARVRERATTALWVLWHRACGECAERDLAAAGRPMERGRFEEAAEAIGRVISRNPNYAEAWNQRATAHYLAGRYELAVHDCRETLERNPLHFGAWHGLGLCFLRLGCYREASRAFGRALALQPHEACNRRALEDCERHLSGGGAA